ncbi:serine hydrolase [Rhodovulum sp. ES.010]|uniref:serine hydrolase domain-containing protein n=1 Tax=Rhodovulum sp. ES.010 TaxID=1882821 RepID=UPI000940AED6|nr:serine hydrolase domain-containing protein [Rhodovulum sp. ES.010]
MRARRLLAAIGLCLVTAAPATARDPASELAEVLDRFRDRYGFPGGTAAIALPGTRLVAAASGLADVEAGRAMTSGTPMLAASLGKSFVAAVVLALESEGRLLQAEHLSEHLGDRLWFDTLPNAAPITIGHLLRHQSGLPDHPHLSEFQTALAMRVADNGAAFTPEEVLAFALGQDPLFRAGAGWAYSDTGYILLGLVIERVIGRPYYDVLREILLDPLALRETRPSDRQGIPGLAVGYTVPGNPSGLPERTADAAGRLVWNPAVEWTGGGLASTASDLARWGQVLFRGTALERVAFNRPHSRPP